MATRQRVGPSVTVSSYCESQRRYQPYPCEKRSPLCLVWLYEHQQLPLLATGSSLSASHNVELDAFCVIGSYFVGGDAVQT